MFPLFRLSSFWGLVCLCLANQLGGAVVVWDNDGTNFETGGNWVGDSAPGAGDSAQFSGAVGNNPVLSVSRSILGVDFQSAGWTLTPNNLTLTVGADGIDSAGAGTNTVDVDVALSANQSWTVGAGNTLSMDEVISGANKLTKDGAGTLYLDGNNTYTGGFEVSAGLAQLSHDNAVGTGIFTISGGSVAAVGTNIDIDNAVVISGNFSVDASNDSLFEFDSTVDLGGGTRTITYNDTSSLRFNDVVSNGGLVLDAGTGLIRLNAANTYTGGTTLQNGRVEVRNSAAFGTGTITVETGSDFNSNDDTLDIDNNWVVNGKLFFTGRGAQLDGNIDLNGGSRTFEIGIDDASVITVNGVISNGSVVKTEADEIIFNSANTYTGDTTLDSGTITAGHNDAFGTVGEIIFNGGMIGSDNDARDVGNDISYTGLTGGFRGKSLTLSGNMDLGLAVRTLSVGSEVGETVTLSGVISGAGGGITKSGSEILQLAGTSANTYTADTTVALGVLQLNKTDGVNAMGGNLVIGDGVGNDTVEWLNNNQLADTADVTVSDSAIFHLNNFSERIDILNIGDGSIDFGTASGANVLLFEDDGSVNGMLTITDFQVGTDVIAVRSGTTLSSSFLSSIRFAGNASGAQLGATGQTVAGYTDTWDYIVASSITDVWNGGDADDSNWSSNDNWSGTAPASSNTARMEFGGSTRPNVVLDSNRTLNTLLFTGTTDFTISGANTLTFDSAATTAELDMESSSNLSISSDIALNADLAIQGSNTGKVTLSGVVSGAKRIFKRDDFTLALTGNNTFSDDFVLQGGTVEVGHDNALGTADLDVSGGTILATGGSRTVSNTVLFSDDFAIGGSNAIEFSGNVDLQGGSSLTLTINNTADTTFSGNFDLGMDVVAEEGTDIHKAGTGRLILTGSNFSDLDANAEIRDFYLEAGAAAMGHNNAFGGRNLYLSDGTTIEAHGAARNRDAMGYVYVRGDVTIGGSQDFTITDDIDFESSARILTVSNTGTTTFNGEVKNAPHFTKSGSGKLILSGDNDASNEILQLTLNAGTLSWGHDDAAGRGDININGGTLMAEINGIDIDQDVNVNADFAISGTEELEFESSLWDLGGATRTITNNTTDYLRIHTGSNITNGGLTLEGSGVTRLDENFTYADGLTLNSGTVQLEADNAPGTGTFTINGGTVHSDDDVRTIDNAIVIGGNFTTENHKLTATGNVDLNGATRTITTSNNADDYLFLQGVVSNGGIIKNGTAELWLSGNNTFTDGVTLNSGILGVRHDNALGTGTFTINGGDIESDNNSREIDNAWVIAGDFTVSENNIAFATAGTVSAGTHTITGQRNLDLKSTVSGTGKLAWAGSNGRELFLRGNNTFSGGFQLDSGTVDVRHDNGFGTGVVTINGGVIQAGAPSRTIANDLVIGGDFETEKEAMTYTGSVTLNAGVHQFKIGQNAGKTVTFSGVISGSGGINKYGAEEMILSGNASNTYTGDTTVTEGTLLLSKTSGNAVGGNVSLGDGSGTDSLKLGGDDQIADTADITFNGGGRFQLNSYDETINRISSSGGNGTIENGGATDSKLTIDTSTTDTFSGLIQNGGGAGKLDLEVKGTGQLSLSGVNTYTGVTTVSDTATLKLGVDSALHASSDLILNGGTFETGGFDVTLDNLTLTANSTIDLGSGTSVLTIAGAVNTGSYTLSIHNWNGNILGGGSEQIFFNGSTASVNFDNIHFYSDGGVTPWSATTGYAGASLLGSNELVPRNGNLVPEPSTWLGMTGLLLLAGWHWRRRVKKA